MGSKHSKDLGQIKSTVSDVLYASLAKPVLVFRFISVIFLIYLNSFISKFSSTALQENMQALNNNSASLLVLVYRRNSGNMSKVLFLNFMKKKKLVVHFQDFGLIQFQEL